jgi:hypothetical protein
MPAEAAAEPSAPGAFADALTEEESNALGAFARGGGFPAAAPASPGNGASSGTGEENSISMPGYNMWNPSSTSSLLIASSPTTSGAFAPSVMGITTRSPEDSFKGQANDLPLNDLDRLFLDLWDDDQLLFPDSLPPIDEMLFPDTAPNLDDMLSPNASPKGDDSSDPDGRSQVPIAAPEAVAMGDPPALAAPAIATLDSVGIPSLIVIHSPELSSPATATGDAHRFAAISPLVPANEVREDADLLPQVEEPATGDNLRPYYIALGMIPCLAAFGYTPSSLRDHVREGQRAWRRLRGYLRRKQ